MNKATKENSIFWIATGNSGKARELSLLLSPRMCYFLSDLKNYKAPEEKGTSFEENARLKAYALKQYLKKHMKDIWPDLKSHARSQDQRAKPCLTPPPLQVLGEDSGLEVSALGKAPGIYSARYAGPQATDKENIYLLLKNMQGLPPNKRQACFVSHIVVLTTEGKEYSVEGRLIGHIALAPQGHKGFGYDPLFVPKGANGTMAQWDVTKKNRFSHRAQAVHRLLSSINFPDKVIKTLCL